ncbi:hypothetical protein [Nonomuraea glycinis]|uniref:hypothetical protein n=1 Tax=Nonomuraea glycinis TaxID=2047744 RepID=UPI002E1167A5|nr:hypothetical protein OHA68_28735 [Nonomuraea glycinis]
MKIDQRKTSVPRCRARLATLSASERQRLKKAPNPTFQQNPDVLLLIGWELLAGLVRSMLVVVLGVILQD